MQSLYLVCLKSKAVLGFNILGHPYQSKVICPHCSFGLLSVLFSLWATVLSFCSLYVTVPDPFPNIRHFLLNSVCCDFCFTLQLLLEVHIPSISIPSILVKVLIMFCNKSIAAMASCQSTGLKEPTFKSRN